jgi:predicted RND superfamily exporter protein
MLTGGAREPEGNDMTLMKDLGWMVLIGLLMPLIMAVAFVGVAIILVQSLYRWARGNTTSTSRVGAPILVSTRSP